MGTQRSPCPLHPPCLDTPLPTPTSDEAQQVLKSGSSEPPKAAGSPAMPVLMEKKSLLGQSRPTVAGQPLARPSAEEYGYIVTDQK